MINRVFFSLFPLLLFGFNNTITAQNGPGSIEDTSGTSNLVLWLDASRIEGISDLNTISQWKDVSGYQNHVSNTTPNAKPHFRENILNGLPVVGFDGSSEHLDGSFGGSFGSPSTVIVVPFFDDINQSASENAYVISIGSGGGNRNHFSIARRNSGGGDGNKYYSWVNDGGPKLGDTIVGQSWNIITQLNSSSSPFHNMYLNGTASTSLSDYAGTVNTDGIFRVGQWYNGGTNRLDGRLAEVIVFNKTLNTPELNIIQSYLSAKYSIAISNDLYNGDDVIRGNNDLDVMGIGMESDVSHSSLASAGIEMSISSGFENGDYILVGHNEANNSINSSDINGTIVSRWERAWWFDISNTGSTNQCDIIFSLIDGQLGFNELAISAEDYRLIYRSGTSGNWSIVATANGTTSSKIIFNDVDLSANGYYTVATVNVASSIGSSPTSTGDKGPAGVGQIDGSSNLKLWYNVGSLDVTTGDQVLSIADASGNGNKVTQETFINIPTYESNKVNSKSAIAFNGANSYLEGTLGFNGQAPLTVFSVGYFNNLNQGNEDNDYIYSIGDGLSRGDQLSVSRRKSNDEDDLANINKYYSWDGDTARFGDVINGQTWYAFTQEYFTTGSALLHTAHINGADANATDNEVEVNSNNNLISIGRWNGNNHWLDGSFSELIIYDRNLNAAEINIVESYLGGKYNISMASDKYDGDDGANGDNDLDIAGIGTESDGSNTSANSDGLLIEQVSGFANGDYVIIGHAVENNSINSSDVSSDIGTIEARWNRAWYADVTNVGPSPVMNLTFDFSDVNALGFPSAESSSEYTLLFRSTSSGTWTALNQSPSIIGDQVIFNSITLATDGFLTLGTSQISNGPLPISLSKFEVSHAEKAALLQWETSSEINNDYFLVERSSNAVDYEEIYKTGTKGNSFETKKYSHLDSDIIPQNTYYYRLTQVDYNGASEQFGPVVLNGKNVDQKIEIYPNPTKDELLINGLSGYSSIELFSFNGERVHHSISESQESKRISLSNLKKGIYYLKVTNNKNQQSLKVILN